MSTPRVRIRQRASTGNGTGTATDSSGHQFESWSNSGITYHASQCNDLQGERGGPFAVNSYTLNGNTLSSTFTSQFGSVYKISNWDFEDNGLWKYGHLEDPGRPPNHVLAVELLRRTNPSKSKLDLPVSVFELRELPGMFKKNVEGALQQAANGKLNSAFGWAPLVNDFNELMKFTESVDKRVKLLKKFQKGPLLRKTSRNKNQLYHNTVSEGGSGPNDWFGVQSWPFPIEARYLGRSTTRTCWGYITYSPEPDMGKLIDDNQALRARATKIIGGSTIDLSNIYQALPWSWLADWMSNLGDYLDAHRNLLPVTPGIPRIMEITSTTVKLEARAGVSGPSHRVQYSHEFVSKSRVLASASLPSTTWGFLTRNQVEILAALAITRGKGGRR